MKVNRLLFFLMAICLSSVVKAQFYDSADDIYYYVYYDKGDFKPNVQVTGGACTIFNFDGNKGCLLASVRKSWVVDQLNKNPNYFEDAVETKEYTLKFVSSTSYKTVYQSLSPYGGSDTYTYIFSRDRNSLTIIYESSFMGSKSHVETTYKKVDKSFFKVGRSRTPSGSMHE